MTQERAENFVERTTSWAKRRSEWREAKNNEKIERELSEHCPFMPNKETEKQESDDKIYDFKQDKWIKKSKNVQALMDWRVKKQKNDNQDKESRD